MLRRRLDLVTGPCPLETLLRRLLAVLAVAATVAAPMAWTWKLPVLGVLVLAWRATAISEGNGTLSLFADGTAQLAGAGEALPVAPTGRAWLSRPLCVVELADVVTGATRRLRVCAANNDADDYRRLLGLLRLEALRPPEACRD